MFAHPSSAAEEGNPSRTFLLFRFLSETQTRKRTPVKVQSNESRVKDKIQVGDKSETRVRQEREEGALKPAPT